MAAIHIQLRKDSKANWLAANPILLDAEIGVETDTKPYKFKFGDGITEYKDLPYDSDIVNAKYINNLLRSTRAYKEVADKLSELESDVQDQFETNFYSLSSATDYNTLSGNKLIVDYQLTSENLIIQQTLPSSSDNKTILMYTNKPEKIVTASLEILPPAGEKINGSTSTITVYDDGMVGLFIPFSNVSGYEFISFNQLHENHIDFVLEDNSVFSAKKVKFKSPLTASKNDDVAEINVTIPDPPEVKINFNCSDNSTLKADTVETDSTMRLTNENGIAVFSVNTDAIKESKNKGLLAYYSTKEIVGASTVNQPFRMTALKPETVIWSDNLIEYDKSTGIINLYPTAENTATTFKIVARSTMRLQIQDENLETYMYLWNVDTNNYVTDFNGQTPIVHKTIDKTLGSDFLELATVISISSLTKIKVIVKDDLFGADMEILDLAMGISAIAIEQVYDNNEPSMALRDYEIMTQQSMRFVKHIYDSSYANAKGIIQNTPVGGGTYPANTIFSENNWIVNFIDAGLFKQNTSPDGNSPCLQMEDDTNGNGFFYIARILEYEDTWLLRGSDLNISVDIVEQTGDFVLIPIIWKGKINSYPQKIINSMDSSGTYVVNTGWALEDSLKQEIPAPATPETTASYTITYTIPSDAINVGFILMPKKLQARSIIKFTDARMGLTDNPVRWVIRFPYQNSEEQLNRDVKFARFMPHNTTIYNFSDWYQLSKEHAAPLYVGDKQAGGNADVVKVGGNQHGDFNQIHNIGRLKFLRDGKVTITTKVSFGADAFESNKDSVTCNLHYIKNSGDGNIANGVDVASSHHTMQIPKSGNVWTDGVRTNKNAYWTCTFDVKANEEYWLACDSIDVPTGGHIYAYPNGFIDIKFLENEYYITQLQDEILSLNKLIRSTTEAKANKAYIEVGYDSSNSKPTLEAKLDTTP